MGDVSGHGIGPAIVAADFLPGCGRCRKVPCELPEMAAKVNAGLYRETDGKIFVTAILGRLDPKSRSLTYLNAGHPPAIVLNSAGEMKGTPRPRGFPFAIVPETPFVADDSVELADGDLILFYTDGLVEVHRRVNRYLASSGPSRLFGRTGPDGGRNRRNPPPCRLPICRSGKTQRRYHGGRRQGPCGASGLSPVPRQL